MNKLKEFPLWQKAFKLTTEVYALTDIFPKEERYALTDQTRRAALSIQANIAESFGRYHNLDKIKFLYYARGSAYETLSFILFAQQRNYITQETAKSTEKEINSVLKGLDQFIKHNRDK